MSRACEPKVLNYIPDSHHRICKHTNSIWVQFENNMEPFNNFKLWYFLYFSAASCLNPFLNIIFRNVYALDASMVGFLALIRPLIGILGGILCSACSDSYRMHSTMLIVCVCISALALQLMQSNHIIQGGYSWLLWLVLVQGFFSAPPTAITDAACCAVVGQERGHESYAHQRLWGAVGWGSCSLLSGWLIDTLGGFHIAYVLHALLSVLVLIPSWRINFDPLVAETKHHEGDKELSFIEKVQVLWSYREARLFFFMMFIMGTAVGTIEGFLFFVIEDYGGTKVLMGLTLTVTCISETIVFYYAQKIIQIIGLSKAIHVCFLAFLIRLAAYSTMQYWSSVWLVLFVEILHGVTFGLTWSVGTQKSKLLSPKGLEATTQSIFQGLLFGVGYGLGGACAGSVYQIWPSATFIVEASILVVGWTISCISSVYGDANGNASPRLKHKHSGMVSLADVSNLNE